MQKSAEKGKLECRGKSFAEEIQSGEWNDDESPEDHEMGGAHQKLIQKSSLGEYEFEKTLDPLADPIPPFFEREDFQKASIEINLINENDKPDGKNDDKGEFLDPRGGYINQFRHDYLFPNKPKLVNYLTKRFIYNFGAGECQ